MEINVGLKVNPPTLTLTYSPEFYETVKRTLVNLGLCEAQITNGWGVGMRLTAYRSTDESLKNHIMRTNTTSLPFIDDINKPLLHNGAFNIAIFRVVPETRGDKKVVEVPLSQMITRWEFNNIRDAIATVFRAILGIVSSDIECTIRFVERAQQRQG